MFNSIDFLSIEKRPVPSNERSTVLMKHFPLNWYKVENQVFQIMDQIAPDYRGSDWNFVELSNGGLFLVPSRPYFITIPFGNFFEGELSPEVCGILATMFAYGLLVELTGDDAFLYHWNYLGEFISVHPDKTLLNRALD